MNQKDYAMKNLNMISRLALLENAKRTRNSVDSLVSILRYMEDNSNKTISTVKAELIIVDKIFFLFEEKKGDSFNGMIIDKTNSETKYIPKGIIIECIDIALRKKIGLNQSLLEVKLVIEANDSRVNVMIQDNGDINKSTDEQELSLMYEEVKKIYQNSEFFISVDKKKNIGTKVTVSNC